MPASVRPRRVYAQEWMASRNFLNVHEKAVGWPREEGGNLGQIDSLRFLAMGIAVWMGRGQHDGGANGQGNVTTRRTNAHDGLVRGLHAFLLSHFSSA